MSRKKLKGFDPGNNNKARRSAYQELQDGPASFFNAAPRAGSDSNRLSGAARRFATQILISKKLDQRDRERERTKAAAEGVGGPQVNAAGASKRKGAPGGTNFMPDYKQALQAQIAAAAEKSAKRQAKDERRRIAREHAAAQPQPDATDLNDAADEFSSGATSAVSLSKSVDQQRQHKADQARSASDKKQRRIDQEAQRNAASAAAASEAAASTAAAAASAASGPALLSDGAVAGAEKVVFTTEMRAGESFRSYQARLVREKAEKMQVEVKGKKMSEKKKRKLSERETKKKSKKDPSLDPREARFQAERDAKDAADEAARAARAGRKGAASSDDADDEPISAGPSKKARTTATEFAPAETVGFGDVADRPPTLTVIPKSKSLPGGKMETERILAGLLLLQEKKKKKGSKGMDADEKEEWVAKQRELLKIKSASESKAQSDLESLRAQSIAAYKASKLRAKDSAASAEEAPKAYVKKSVLKKQKRNRERLQGFKDAQELDADMEIEMAGGFDD